MKVDGTGLEPVTRTRNFEDRPDPGPGWLEADDLVRATGTRVSSRPVASRSAETTAAVDDDRRRLADALDAVGRVGLGILDQLRHDRRHVERGRDQVVGEARVA